MEIASIAVNKRTDIEDDVNIASGVTFMDSDSHPKDMDDRIAHLPPRLQEIRPIRIYQSAWIGRGCTIMKGVTIGESAIIRANRRRAGGRSGAFDSNGQPGESSHQEYMIAGVPVRLGRVQWMRFLTEKKDFNNFHWKHPKVQHILNLQPQGQYEGSFCSGWPACSNPTASDRKTKERRLRCVDSK